MKFRKLLAALVLCLCPVLAAAQGPKIEHIVSDIFRAQNRDYYSLIVRTDEGTVVVDPNGAKTAAFVVDHLARIGAPPVTHLIYSHSHADHAAGGRAFEGAITIAHQNAPKTILGVPINQRFEDHHTFTLGDKTLELTYLGPGHGADSIAVIVRPENLLFVVDVASPRRFFFTNFSGANLDNWQKQLEKAESLDFDIFAGGHGTYIGNRQDLTDMRLYLDELRAGVLAGLREGKTVRELIDTMLMPDRRHWEMYEYWRAGNIDGMAAYLSKQGLVTD